MNNFGPEEQRTSGDAEMISSPTDDITPRSVAGLRGSGFRGQLKQEGGVTQRDASTMAYTDLAVAPRERGADALSELLRERLAAAHGSDGTYVMDNGTKNA